MSESPRLPPETFALGRIASLLVLIDVDGDCYIFPALPRRDESLRPPVVVIPRSREGDRLIQLRPTLDTDIPSGDNN
ncbi:hypothetical protein [Oscillatoria acuminata]|uniref:Uncharacterized protein n=1 Tax=Oscillatoria acuminata PCC 6304 TaxID=56110 RepID=K9TLZ7_9CYAN|nr:hypothetical protein [Oscillatoria acuminata]AFY83433.1 hypothetical protein Oscil6304_3883 [Oscillatoria acuminata PCC 6304]